MALKTCLGLHQPFHLMVNRERQRERDVKGGRFRTQKLTVDTLVTSNNHPEVLLSTKTQVTTIQMFYSFLIS
uniref:Uncharacterized protein n=1 Tax=Arundo donax TaxID=35708 RepID=A0A0A9GDQ6_ARUDO